MWGKRAVVAVLLLCGLTACGQVSTADYRTAVTSGAAHTDRAANDSWAEEHLNALQTGLPWASWTATRIHEVCTADHSTTFGQPDPGTATCVTSWTRQAGFDGDLVDRIRAVDTVATGLHWSGANLQRPIQYYGLYRGRPEGSHVYGAGDLPGVGYSNDTEKWPDATACGGPGLGESWAQAPASVVQVRLHETDGSLALFSRSSGPEPMATVTSLLTSHPFVLTLGLSARCTYKAN